METNGTTSWAARNSTDTLQTTRSQRGGRPLTPGPSRYRTGVSLPQSPPVPAIDASHTANPFADTFKRSDSIGSRRSSINLHPDIATREEPRTGIVPFRLEAQAHRGVAAPWWQRSVEVPLSASNIALVIGSFGCLLGVIALGVAVRADTRDPIKDDLRKHNSTLAFAITQYVAAAFNATRHATEQ